MIVENSKVIDYDVEVKDKTIKVPINVIKTGSSGNCVMITKQIMVDCGVSKKTIANLEPKILLLTHHHSDHINKAAYKFLHNVVNVIFAPFETYTFLLNKGLPVEKIRVIHDMRRIGDFEITPRKMYHSVECYGYEINYHGVKICYATDTMSFENFEDEYDIMLLESNYDEDIIWKEYISEYRRKASLKHISKQASKVFYYAHRRNRDSVYIELHMSRDFY